MKFSTTDRTLMKMLFERGTVSEFSGACKVYGHDQKWTVRLKPVNGFREEAHFEADVTGIYNQVATGYTLDKCLDELEAILGEAAA